MKKIFENSTYISAGSDQVREVLANPARIIQWVPEIKIKKIDDKTFQIIRNQSAINRFEQISIENTINQVIYHSIGGKIEYQLIFKFDAENNGTKVVEEFFLINHVKLPLILFKPVIKHAFNLNLQNLAKLMEMAND